MSVAQHLDYLVAFKRGKRISAGLGEAWMHYGEYRQARAVLDAALTQDLILDGIDDPEGVQVMTIHKSKGKQFDGVLIMRGGDTTAPQLCLHSSGATMFHRIGEADRSLWSASRGHVLTRWSPGQTLRQRDKDHPRPAQNGRYPRCGDRRPIWRGSLHSLPNH